MFIHRLSKEEIGGSGGGGHARKGDREAEDIICYRWGGAVIWEEITAWRQRGGFDGGIGSGGNNRTEAEGILAWHGGERRRRASSHGMALNRYITLIKTNIKTNHILSNHYIIIISRNFRKLGGGHRQHSSRRRHICFHVLLVENLDDIVCIITCVHIYFYVLWYL